MCGIIVSCNPSTTDSQVFTMTDGKQAAWQALLSLLLRRGPDGQNLLSVPIVSGKGSLELGSTLLHLRGTQQPVLPHQRRNGDILLFNGEVFGGIEVARGCCDSSALLEALATPQADIPYVLSVVEGPWALAFWQQDTQTLWVARDPIGRRSLLLRERRPGYPALGFVIASTAMAVPSLPECAGGAQGWDVGATGAASTLGWKEVEPGILSICLGANQTGLGWQYHEWTDKSVLQRIKYARSGDQLLRGGVAPGQIQLAATQVAEVLEAAVRIHCNCIDRPQSSPAQPSSGGGSAIAPVLILFSGGVDSTLIAALAHQVLPQGVPIDLATICFDKGNSPDRKSALDAVEELSQVAPDREWRLIEVDACLADIDTHREHLLDLLKPAATVMDLNIGAALWLAARGKGLTRVYCSGKSTAPLAGCDGAIYRSAARVVLVGHGADEQCAGYGRHRTKFRQTGQKGLHSELQLDMQRLWLRNLGRDDRLIADHGRESRHPFLDEAFVTAILNLPLSVVADLEKPAGVGDKQLLRQILRDKGLPRAASRVKRAIQFGTRLGKLANIRDFGTNRSSEARHAGTMAL